jgi:magnesium-transporting ATPase (P-type)
VLYGQRDEKKQTRPEDEFPLDTPKKKPQVEGHVSYNFKDERLDNLHKGTMSENPQINLSLYHHSDQQSSKPLLTFKNQIDLAREFLFLLAVCHDCILDTNEEGVSTYQGQSPDEITLVDAAKRLGFEFFSANSTSKNIRIFGTPTRIRVLKYFEFNSDRKRASVIIKDKETGTIKLLIKGADSVIMERLEKSRNCENISLINQHLENFSNKGLRTLCMAERILSEEEYTELDAKMLEAASKTDREQIIGSLCSPRQACQ